MRSPPAVEYANAGGAGDAAVLDQHLRCEFELHDANETMRTMADDSHLHHVEDGKVAHEHVYWDQACVVVQIGALDPEGLPVTGAEQARGLAEIADR